MATICAMTARLEGGFIPTSEVTSSNGQEEEQQEESASLVSRSPDVRIEVNIAALRMTIFENDIPVEIYPVAIGSGLHPTPEEESEVKRIEWNPWWYPPKYSSWAKNAKPASPGPGNPLGSVKFPLGGDVLFHGTNNEASVGRAVSHGCMRMKNAHAVELGWYLQSRFSEKTDPGLREMYAKNRGTTYVVPLARAIPVKLVYRPIVVQEESLVLYPDHYRKMSRHTKERVFEELMAKGAKVNLFDPLKVLHLATLWPGNPTEILFEELYTHPPAPQSTTPWAEILRNNHW